MNHPVYYIDLLELLGLALLALWIAFWGISVMIGHGHAYIHWTTHTLENMFRHAWQLILGLAIGYVIGLEHFHCFSFTP